MSELRVDNQINADPAELQKFSALANRWWDPNSEFKPLHDINPLRLGHIDRAVGGLSGKNVLDVGCGGGILAESMAEHGAEVMGIDLSEKALKVAKLHLMESGRTVDYRLVSAEALADAMPSTFDVVTCMELLEHVPDPQSTIKACATLVKPGGHVFFSTINRNPKAYLFASSAPNTCFNCCRREPTTTPSSSRPPNSAPCAARPGWKWKALQG